MIVFSALTQFDAGDSEWPDVRLSIVLTIVHCWDDLWCHPVRSANKRIGWTGDRRRSKVRYRQRQSMITEQSMIDLKKNHEERQRQRERQRETERETWRWRDNWPSLTHPLSVSRMFPALISRCICPLPWRNSRPSNAWEQIAPISSSCKGFLWTKQKDNHHHHHHHHQTITIK